MVRPRGAAPEPEPRWIELEAGDGRILLSEAEPFEPASGRREDAGAALLAALNGQPTTWANWAREADMDPKNGTARRARDELRDRGLVHQGQDGLWALTANGEAAA